VSADDGGAARLGRGAAEGLVLPLALLALWEAASRLGALPDYLVRPTIIAALLYEMTVVTRELWPHVADSLFRALGGFALGAFFGIAAGLLAGVSAPIRRFYDPLISLTSPMPKVILLPILMVWLGLGDASKIAAVMISVFYPSFINAFYGARAVNRVYVWSARNMGAGPVRIFLRVVLPAALPQIFAGARVGLALSFIIMFASELVTSKSGLGHLVHRAEDFARFDLMFVAVVSIGVLGFAADRALLALRRRLLAGVSLSKA